MHRYGDYEVKKIHFKYLITGSAGFIGSALTIRLLERGDVVLGIDNHNDYYDPAIKQARLNRFSKHPNYTHFRVDLADRKEIEEVFDKHYTSKADVWSLGCIFYETWY